MSNQPKPEPKPKLEPDVLELPRVSISGTVSITPPSSSTSPPLERKPEPREDV